MTFMNSFISGAVYAAVVTASACFDANPLTFKWRSSGRPTNETCRSPPSETSGSTSSDSEQSLSGFSVCLKEDTFDRKTAEDWTIPANHGHGSFVGDADTSCFYPCFTGNYLVWSSKTLDQYSDVSTQKTTDKMAPTVTTATAATATPALLELQPQKSVSPYSTSPEFQKIRKMSAAGHALRPRSLGAAFAFGTASAYHSPVNFAKRPDKPRTPQIYSASRTMHP